MATEYMWHEFYSDSIMVLVMDAYVEIKLSDGTKDASMITNQMN